MNRSPLGPNYIDRIRDQYVKGHAKVSPQCHCDLQECHGQMKGKRVSINLFCLECAREATFTVSADEADAAGVVIAP